MKILLTGANGYIGKRLLPVLVSLGHHVVCCVRNKGRFNPAPAFGHKVEVIEVDFLREETLANIPPDINGAYYLIHSMSASTNEFAEMEAKSASNFRESLKGKKVKHVVYLGGIVNADELSGHLQSRKTVELILSEGDYAFTAIRAGIILGSGSASFEIMRDLVEKLPVMIAPRWLQTPSQPIAIRNVIQILSTCLFNESTYNDCYDIGGPEVMTYKQMLLQFAKVRQLRRLIITVPVMTPRLSSYWLFFVTSTSYQLAVNLVNSMKVPVICRDNRLAELLGIELIGFEQAINLAFERIQQNEVLSSWIDSYASSGFDKSLGHYIQMPDYGCFKDIKTRMIDNREKVIAKIWSIGGSRGWYYGNFLWKIRGYLDKLVGGVGLRRGRTHPAIINTGDSLDFWRVLHADKSEGRLLLFAEMKLPGEAWLEFRIEEGKKLIQTATFRPRGLLGRLYWYTVLPFHYFIFNGLIDRLARGE